MSSCFHTSLPVVFSSLIARLLKYKRELFSKVASGFLSHDKIWSPHADLWDPSWSRPQPFSPSPTLFCTSDHSACSHWGSGVLFPAVFLAVLASWCPFECCPIQKEVLTLLSTVSYSFPPSVTLCPLAPSFHFLLSTNHQLTCLFYSNYLLLKCNL